MMSAPPEGEAAFLFRFLLLFAYAYIYVQHNTLPRRIPQHTAHPPPSPDRAI